MAVLLVAFMRTAEAQQDLEHLNDYVLKAVEWMATNVSKRGYVSGAMFTEKISYGTQCCLEPTNDGATMCVAAVEETIVRAVNMYIDKSKDESPVKQLSIDHWTGKTRLHLRPALFQWQDANSRGPGDALSRFGIGELVEFTNLKPGDFLAFSRRGGPGHAVVFLGYLTKTKEISDQYSNQVVGFRYFSSQGRGRADAGLGYRNAYFEERSKCKAYARTDYPSDCGIFYPAYLNAGRLWHPSKWNVADAIKKIRDDHIAYLQKLHPRATRAASTLAADILLSQELPELYSVKFE